MNRVFHVETGVSLILPLKEKTMTASKYTINDLPELPLEAFELGGSLEQNELDPVLSINPLKMAPPIEPPSTVAHIKKCEFQVRKYLTQVLYPKVICHPPNELFDTAIARVLQQPHTNPAPNEVDLEAISKHRRFYKLSSYRGAKLTTPFFCTVRYGPWSAMVVEQESCTTGVPNLWTLYVTAFPELVLTWYGVWLDVPSYPSLQVIKGDLSLISEHSHCCPGCTWCKSTNSCIPSTIKCENQSPV